MARLRHIIILRAGTWIGAAVTVSALAFALRSSARIRGCGAELRRLGSEWRALAAMHPLPDAEGAGALEQEPGRARARLSLARGWWQAPGVDPCLSAGEAPPTRTDAYFELVRGAAGLRGRAGAAAVDVRPDESFGFAAYASAGPAPELIPQIHLQWRIAACLVDRLIEAHPRAIIAVQRARLDREEQAAGRTRDRADPAVFPPGPWEPLQVPLPVRRHAFRFIFTGRTCVLRRFLARLAEPGLPVAVRLVEAAPAAQDAARVIPAAAAAGEPRQAESRFTVTVEHLGLEEACSGP